MGNPYRQLDTRQRVAKADKTYEVLSGLAKAAIGVSNIVKEEHNAEMERRAKNDLVNNTINPDMQRHERIYATTVAKGQALDTFRELQGRIQGGEFDDLDPQKFQETMNQIHAQKAEEYGSSKYRDEAVSTWNDFWVNQESTLTAGQAGKYRVALKGKQESALSDNIIQKYSSGKYAPKDIINELTSDDYSLLSTDNILDLALDAGATLAAQGDNKLLEVLNQEYDFTNDPERYKKYDAATKIAHRKQRMVAEERVMQATSAFHEAVSQGKLTEDMYNQEIIPGVVLSKAVDLEGNRVVTDKQFGKALEISKGNFVKHRQYDKAKEMLVAGRNLTGVFKPVIIQDVFNEITRETLQGTENPMESFAQLGNLATKQTENITAFENIGGSFAGAELFRNNEVSPEIIDTFMNLGALKQGYNNDPKFYRALGQDGAARYKAIEYESFWVQGSPEDKIKGAIEKLAQMKEAKEKGLTRNITTLSEETKTEITKAAEKYFDENDSLWRIDDVQEFGARDFEQYVGQRYRDYVNKYNMNPKAALELAVDDTKGITTEWDGSLVFTGGATLDLGESPEYTIKTLQNDPDLSQIIAEEYSSGVRYNIPKDPGLITPTKPTKIPDYEKVRIVPDYTNDRIMWVDHKNKIVHSIPTAHAKMLNEARKQYIWPVWSKVQDTFGKIADRPGEAPLGRGAGQNITVQDIEE
jgi:hypothetical protein